MLSVATRQTRKARKKEWNIYHNIGVRHDAERFSLIDTVLDGELNNFTGSERKGNTHGKQSRLLRALKQLMSKSSNRLLHN